MILLRYCFNSICFLIAFGMTIFWFHKLLKDEDLCQVDFKSIETYSTQKLDKEDETMVGGARYNDQQETTTYEVNHQSTPQPDPISQELQELNEKIFTMMERREEKMPNKELRYSCKHCGKEGTNGTIRRHIESNHLELAPFPCNLCEKTCKSSRALREHKNKYHESKVIHDSDLSN